MKKKLKISKTTVASLNRTEMSNAKGGNWNTYGSYQSALQTNCPAPSQQTCGCGGGGGTTSLRTANSICRAC